ncbi:ATP-binding protein [Moraxella haemolytica]|uniref:sensor histidine kinase n=1 Tax=Moraxella haemolytica TaxID=2904119 RepID=UPI0025429CD7|nr:sensor histidine kinase [Moraxella sp. ZY171148]WII94956.1 ATP-binding protein [Moraxella sp. ZY171148]
MKHHSFGLNSLFTQLFISVFLAIIAFAIAMVFLAQLVHNNSDTVRAKAVAEQILAQVDPLITQAEALNKENELLKSRFILAVVKRSFDIFDESLNAKIGLYSPTGELILQTEDSTLPVRLINDRDWLDAIIPGVFSPTHHHVILDNSAGYHLWYESRIPPKEKSGSAALNLFTGTLLLILIMSAVLWWIARNITWRINHMSQQMVKLGDGDFSVRVSEQGNDEIASLAYGFNQSAQKIEQLINANNLLLAHASHEFRTPITRIRLQIEMMDMLVAKLDDDTKSKFDKRAAAINRDLTGLNELVESILLVSRLDAGHALEATDQIDLYELVKSECQHYSEVSLFAESVIITAQPKLLTHLVRNLLNNAMIHGVPPIEVYLYNSIDLSCAAQIPNNLAKTPLSQLDDDAPKKSKKSLLRFTRQKDNAPKEPVYAVLAFIDQGEGIPKGKREDIFSPFVRLKQEKKGSGLGLSLVSQIVEAHAGKITTDTWQGKTRFLVTLPLKGKSTLKDSSNRD